MARPRYLAASCLVILVTLASVITLVPVRTTRAQTMQSVPDEIAYRRIFNYTARLKQRADLAQQQGKDLPGLRQLVRRDAGLSEYEGTVLEQVSAQCEAEVAAQDAKARAIKHRLRAQFPQGFVPRGATLPPPPPELAQMWQERNAIILSCRDRLRNALGEDSFARFDTYVKGRISGELQPAVPVAGQ